MPISRYEIRNEYSLADPELYRAADKDDPEALLEGVAMAGLVGVLRQLGDLAEFAADIFHNLHEDVMATAARGHVLAVRVQQLEAEIPSVERAFLSQTDHSSFFYHPGVDWHPNLRPNKNLITQGDMPRFIMDSYEECRAPPRLFLLDKFDVAGAGACLKRYTDPSFFKVGTSEMTTADVQREKKIRKTKKKRTRWKNREPPEVSSTSHTKLHQLFLEERIENGVSTLSSRVKLKRRLNGFPFNSKNEKSYMEEILKTPSPDHEVFHDMTGDSPQLKLATNGHKEFSSEMFEFRPVSPGRESGVRNRSTRPYSDIECDVPHHPIYDPDEYPIDDKIFEVSSSHPSISIDGISSALDKVTGEKVIAVNAESKKEDSLASYESDDITSEIDNYVDAPSAIESEMDRVSDSRMKKNDTSVSKMGLVIGEPFHSRSSDSQSTGDSTISDGGNNSLTRDISSFSSDSPDTSAEKSQPESFSSKGFQCSDVPVNMIDNGPSYQETADEDIQVDRHSRPVVSDDICAETDAIINRQSSDLDEVGKYLSKPPKSDEMVSSSNEKEDNTQRDLGQSLVVSDGSEPNSITNQATKFEKVTSTLCIKGSMPTLQLSDPEEALVNFKRQAPGSYEMASTLDGVEKINLAVDPPSSPSAALVSQAGDDLSRSSDEEQLVDEPNGESETCFSAEHDICHHTKDSSVKTSSSLLREYKSDGEDQELADDAASTLYLPNVLQTNDTLDIMSAGTRIPDEFEDEFPDVPRNFIPDYPDAANNGNNIESKVNDLIGMKGDEESNVSNDSLNKFPCIVEASPEKGIVDTLLVGTHSLNVDNHHSNSFFDHQINLENLNSPHLANSSDRPMDGCDVHEGDVIHEEGNAANETIPPEIPEYCEVESFQGTGISYHISDNDSEALERLHSTPLDLEEPAGTSDTVEMGGISVSQAQEVVEIMSFSDLRPGNEINVLLNKSSSEADRSNSTIITSQVLGLFYAVSLGNLVEERNDSFDVSGIDELEKDDNDPSECHGKLDLVERVGPTESSALGLGTVVYNSTDKEHPKSEPSGLVPNSHLDIEFDHSPECIHAAKIQSTIEQCSLDRERELFNETSLQNHAPDASSLPVSNDTEEPVPDHIGLPPSHLNQNLLHPVEISSDLSPSLPINYLQILDDDAKGANNLVSGFSLANGSSPPSIPELSRLNNDAVNIPGYPKDSISPASNPFLKAHQINLSDSPPLPPLPPVQWRMGKLQHALPSAEEETINKESFPQPIFLMAPSDDFGSTLSKKPTQGGASLLKKVLQDTLPSAEEETIRDKESFPRLISLNVPTDDVGSTLSTKPTQVDALPSAEEETIRDEESFPRLMSLNVPTDDVGSTLSTKPTQVDALPSAEEETIRDEESFPQLISLNVPTDDVGSTLSTKPTQDDALPSAEEETIRDEESFPRLMSLNLPTDDVGSTLSIRPTKDDASLPTASIDDIILSREEMKDSPTELATETTLKEENLDNGCSSSDARTLHECTDNTPNIENKPQPPAMPISEGVSTSSAAEDGAENGRQKMKLPRPRNPLVEDVSFLDKSKLRKVADRVRPEVKKVEERDSLLEQIRAKSFNLRPATSTRSSIPARGPNTNLKVVAILEKANAIRQAFAGSDEDDDDSWSE